MNFVGSEDEYVASGSDDGNFFLWEKGSGRLHGIYEGDGSVVNVIEAHPRLPLLAVSGIDTTVKVRFDWISYSEVQDDLHILSCLPLLEAKANSPDYVTRQISLKQMRVAEAIDNISR